MKHPSDRIVVGQTNQTIKLLYNVDMATEFFARMIWESGWNLPVVVGSYGRDSVNCLVGLPVTVVSQIYDGATWASS